MLISLEILKMWCCGLWWYESFEKALPINYSPLVNSVPRSESSSASDPADSVNFSVIVNLKNNNVNIPMAFIAKKEVTY